MSEALKLKEEGKTIPEILDFFPNYKNELRKMFQVIDIIGGQKKNIVPPKELLNKIITNEEISRYLEQEAEDSHGRFRISRVRSASERFSHVKGRPSSEISQIHETMTFNWKIVIPVGLAIIVVAIFAYTQFVMKAPQYATETTTGEEIALPQATGNVDDAVNAILAAVLNEQSVLQTEESDASLITSDTQAISDFGQSYNENAF